MLKQPFLPNLKNTFCWHQPKYNNPFLGFSFKNREQLGKEIHPSMSVTTTEGKRKTQTKTKKSTL
jgi:hypothetical protein